MAHRRDRTHPGSGRAGRDGWDGHRWGNHRDGPACCRALHRDHRDRGRRGDLPDRRDRGPHRGHHERRRDHRGHGHRGRHRRQQETWASSPGWGAASRDDPGLRRHDRQADAADGCRRPRAWCPRQQQPAARRDDVPCPGWPRTGCCPDAGRRGDRPDGAPARAPSAWPRQPGSKPRAAPRQAARPARARPQASRRQVPARQGRAQQRPEPPRPAPGRQAPRARRQGPWGRAWGPASRRPSSAPASPPQVRRGRRPSGTHRPPCGNASPRGARRLSSPT